MRARTDLGRAVERQATFERRILRKIDADGFAARDSWRVQNAGIGFLDAQHASRVDDLNLVKPRKAELLIRVARGHRQTTQ